MIVVSLGRGMRRWLPRCRAWSFGLLLAALGSGPAAAQPPSLSLHSAVYVPGRQSLLLFGGTPDTQFYENDTWELTLDLDPRWHQVQTEGTRPSGRLGQSAVYDPVRERMLVFGGLDGNFQILGDVWAVSSTDSTWTQLQPTGTPPTARRYHSAIYDPVRDRMILFAGDAGFGNVLGDAWTLWLSPSPHWERILPNGTPPTARYGHSAIYDPVRDRMIVFGGNGPSNDLWALTFADTTWRLLAPGPTLPSPRLGHTAIYDPADDRMVVFGGSDGNQFLDEVWLLYLGGTSLAWSQASPGSPSPSVRQFHTAVYDSAYRRMVVFGGQPGVTEPTWALSMGPSPRWSPEAPLIDAPATLSLPIVTLGDTVRVPFSVTNRGLQPLQISGFEVSSPQLQVSAPGPAPLAWNVGLNETLSVAASAAGVTDETLAIVSNDPSTPRRQIALHLDVRALDFATHVLEDPDSVAPGVSFIVVVTPRPGVHVERGKVFYRIAGGSSPFDSLALTPLATDFIAAIPAGAVTEHGVEYFVRVENSGYLAHQPGGAPVSFFTQKVAAPQSLAAVIPRPTGGSDFLDRQAIEIDVQLPGGAIFDSGLLSYRQGGDAGYETTPFEPTGISGQVAAVIPDSVVGPRGLEYRVTMRTLRATILFPASGQGPATIRTTIPSLTEPQAHPGGRYRLLSVPLDFGPNFSGSLDALLADELSTYDPTRWRAFLYDPVAPGNIEFSAQPTRFRPVPGRAFWLISRDDHRLDTGPIGAFSTPSGAEYPLTLPPGWNLIGNPFDFPVFWSEVGGDTALVDDPVAFDPSKGSIGDYSDVTPLVLQPFEGYFVHATQGATLRVPNRAALLASPAQAARSHDVAGWRARLSARTAEAQDGANTIGIAAGSSAGFDALDLRKPPTPPGPWVRVAIVHPEWGARAGEYRHDLRAPGTEGETWEIELKSAHRGEVVTLELSELANGAPAVRLLDREQGTSLDWRNASALRAPLEHEVVSFGDRPYRLAVVAGSEEYVRDAAVRETPSAPARTMLDRVAPNPFFDATRIRFGLPRTSAVKLEIYGLQGERIASLLDGDRLDAGFHTAVWDGRRSGGGRAASGVYVARLEVEGTALTTRLVLVR